jgi:hypothetical protein
MPAYPCLGVPCARGLGYGLRRITSLSFAVLLSSRYRTTIRSPGRALLWTSRESSFEGISVCVAFSGSAETPTGGTVLCSAYSAEPSESPSGWIWKRSNVAKRSALQASGSTLLCRKSSHFRLCGVPDAGLAIAARTAHKASIKKSLTAGRARFLCAS